jgi:8-oxo-dGTP pyrophosphatase MutT (NUDIX family)
MSAPEWMNQLITRLPTLQPSDLSRHAVPEESTREAAVLVLFGPRENFGEVVIIERASHLKAHPGQPAFPGGRVEEGDSSLSQTALREAKEEIGLNPDSIEILGELPQLWIPPSNFKVTPVLGWWHTPHEITNIDANEVQAVHQIPLTDLINPSNRTRVRHINGSFGPGFNVESMLIWGFTGGLISRLMDIAGWSIPWDESVIVELTSSSTKHGSNKLNPLYLDLILVGFAIFILVSGWRRGLFVSIFSLLGLIAGAWIGRSVIDIVNGASTTTSLTRTALSAATLFIGIGVGSAVGGFIGRRLRNVFSWSPLRLLDNLTGAALSLVAWSIVFWLLATTLLAAPVSSFTNTVSQSKVLNALEQYMPIQVRDGVESVRIYVSDSGLPEGFANVLLAPAVEPPDLTSVDAPAVIAGLDSVVKVEGIAEECGTRLTGSGFVVGPDLIITNAHVVAGVENPTLRVKGKGKAFEGIVVYFDPARDVAVIRTKDFPSVALRISEPLSRGDNAVVAGFPGGGPLTLIPARVRSVSDSTGTDIYGKEK